jgi:ubiquinone/menaquinone biosynthesis C-methylase UbiE
MPSNDTHVAVRETDRSQEVSGTSSAAFGRDKSPDEIAEIYGEVADTLDQWSWADRLFTGRFRRRQFGDAEGRVLDVACGTGTNFPYLPVSVDLVGIDISAEMLANAREELDRLGLDGSLHRMDARALDFPDDSFDTVVSAFSTCTFPDPVGALREMRRVCRPDGRVLLLEHGRSDVAPVSRFQDWRADAHYEKRGCRWNQDPVEHVHEAGLPVVETRRALLGMVTSIEALPR